MRACPRRPSLARVPCSMRCCFSNAFPGNWRSGFSFSSLSAWLRGLVAAAVAAGLVSNPPAELPASRARPALPMIWPTVPATVLRSPVTGATGPREQGQPLLWGPGIPAVQGNSPKLCSHPALHLPPGRSLPRRHPPTRKPPRVSSLFLPPANGTCDLFLSSQGR